MGVLIAVGVAALAAVTVLLVYNRLVWLRNRTEQGWAQIDVQLQRRHDLVPNLVDTVKAYAAHEQDTFRQVVEARLAAIAATGANETAGAEAGLAGAVARLFAVAEAYPELKADGAFRQLQTELAATEDRIAYARRYYNDAVRAYDTAREQFPGTLVARPFGFEPVDYFEIEDAELRAAPSVER